MIHRPYRLFLQLFDIGIVTDFTILMSILWLPSVIVTRSQKLGDAAQCLVYMVGYIYFNLIQIHYGKINLTFSSIDIVLDSFPSIFIVLCVMSYKIGFGTKPKFIRKKRLKSANSTNQIQLHTHCQINTNHVLRDQVRITSLMILYFQCYLLLYSDIEDIYVGSLYYTWF